MKKSLKNKWLLGAVLIVVVVVFWFTFSETNSGTEVLTAESVRGSFNITVITTGEIRAKQETDIDAPGPEMREAGLWNGTKIQDLVEEGTVVKAGDFVASLDKSALMTRLQEVSLEYDKKESELKQARLDTAITLRDARDELLNLASAVQEARLEVEQSAYEAPAIQQQKKLALEKSIRNLEQKKENYSTKVEQSATKVAIIQADLQKAANSLNLVTTLMQKMDIKAPEDGMVIYVRDWNGKKKGAGSNVSPWETAVATLPDLREMQVVTYVNEVDIRKIKEGQAVQITLDAEPDKKLDGVVVQVANIGEQRPGQDSKVFEVLIDVLTKDESLRPSMTTSNKILIDGYRDVVSVPLEAINAEKNYSYIWVKADGLEKREVKIAAVNDMSALIYSGLSEKETVYLSFPGDTAGEQIISADSSLKAPKPYVDKALKKRLDEYIEKQKSERQSERANMFNMVESDSD